MDIATSLAFDINDIQWITPDLLSTDSASPCLLCNKYNIKIVNQFRLNGKHFDVVRCDHDGLMWTNPQLPQAFYDALYESHYHDKNEDNPLAEQAGIDVYDDVRKEQQKARMNMDQLQRVWMPQKMQQFRPYERRGSLIEVGFGSGHVLEEANKRCWLYEGVELSPHLVEKAKARGLHAYFADFSTYQPAYFWRKPDAILMYSVLEHVLTPLSYLQHARELISDDGVLILRIPNTPPQGPSVCLLSHVYHFNQHTIVMLLSRAGFMVQSFENYGCWQATKYPGHVVSMNVIAHPV